MPLENGKWSSGWSSSATGPSTSRTSSMARVYLGALGADQPDVPGRDLRVLRAKSRRGNGGGGGESRGIGEGASQDDHAASLLRAQAWDARRRRAGRARGIWRQREGGVAVAWRSRRRRGCVKWAPAARADLGKSRRWSASRRRGCRRVRVLARLADGGERGGQVLLLVLCEDEDGDCGSGHLGYGIAG